MTLTITARQIDQWASQREAQHLLPALIRRLIVEALSPNAIGGIDFPAFENISRKGFDGVLTTQETHAYIPRGESVWEISATKAIKQKADEDFDNRVKDACSDTTFTFVTARNWSGKKEWLKDKQNSTWGDVRVYDANDLEQWLEWSPSTTLWLSEQMGVSQNHIQSPAIFLKNWLGGTVPPLPRSLILQDRDEIKSEVLEFVKRPHHNDSMTVFADTSNEALAFICATLDSVTSFKSLVIKDKEGIDELRPWQKGFQHPYVIIARTNDLATKIPSDLTRKNLLLIAEARGVVAFNPSHGKHLSLPRIRNFDALDMGHEELGVLRKRAGGSLSALHRQLNRNQGKKTPPWAKLSKTRNFIWLALIGGWDERHEGDKEIIQELSRVASFDDWRDFASTLLAGEDAPLAHTNENEPQYKLFSRIDAFLAISQKIRGDEIDHLLKTIQKVYLEGDPNYHPPDDDYPHFHKDRKYSNALRQGIMGGLAILVCYNERGVLTCGDVSAKIKKFFADMFADDKAWAKLLDILPNLAEVSPSDFIWHLQETLQSAPEKIADLFAKRRDLVWDDSYNHPPLLWALEGLAWNADDLERVLDILCKLQHRYEGGIKSNYMNRPSESMNSILRSWMPQTSADVDQRIKALRNTYDKHPNEVVKLALVLAGRDSTATLSHMPIWRDDVLAKKRVTNADYLAMIAKAVNLIIEYLRDDSHALKDRVEISYQAMNDFPWWTIKKAQKITEAICNLPTNDDALNRRLYDSARDWASRYQQFHMDKKNAEEILAMYKEIHAYFQPRSLAERHAYLFSDSARMEFYREDRSYEKSSEKLYQAREAAVLEIYEKNSIAGLVALLKRAEAPGTVAASLYASHISRGKFPNLADYLIAVLDADIEVLAKRVHLAFLFYDLRSYKLRDVDAIIADIKPVLDRVADVKQKAILLQSLRIDEVDGQKFISDQPDEVQQHLFSHVWISRGNELRPEKEGGPPPPESTWLIDRYLHYKHPRLALASFIGAEWIPIDRQAPLLDAIFVDQWDVGGDKDGIPDNYQIEQMFEAITKHYANADDNMLAQLADLEIKLHGFLSHSAYEKSGGFILRHLARTPAYFVDLHKYVYKDEDDNIPPLPIKMPEVNAKVYAQVAFRIFHDLDLRTPKSLPWVNTDNTLDTKKLRDWVAKVRQIAKKEKMSGVVDRRIGTGLSHSRISSDSIIPEFAICDIMRDHDSRDMYEGFRTGRYNSRGVTTGDRDNQGFTSAGLSHAYTVAADELIGQYPDMANVMRDLADSYQRMAAHWQSQQERINIDFR